MGSEDAEDVEVLIAVDDVFCGLLVDFRHGGGVSDGHSRQFGIGRRRRVSRDRHICHSEYGVYFIAWIGCFKGATHHEMVEQTTCVIVPDAAQIAVR